MSGSASIRDVFGWPPVALSPADLAVLAVFLTAVVLLGLRAARARRAGLDDYLLAGRTLTMPSFVATLVPTWFGGVLGVGEFSYSSGLLNWAVQGVPYYLFGLAYAWLLAGKVREASGRTVPDHVEAVYGKKVAVAAALWVAVLACPADEMLMLGTLFRWVTGWGLELCVPLAALVGISFLALGGLRADVWTNRLEIVFMFGGFALILPWALSAVGGWEGLQSRLPAEHLSLSGGRSWGYHLTWFFIAFWTFVDPAFHQRVCAAKDVRTAQWGVVVSVCFWFAFDLMTTTAGLCSRALIPDLNNPLMAYPELAAKILPPVIRGLFIAGVSASVLAALAAVSFVCATTLAKDGAGRLLNVPVESQERWVRWGLLLAGLLSIVLALAVPSVVSLWYMIGSSAVPGLLVLMLSCYFERLRVGPGFALASSLCGGGASLAWLIIGLLAGPPGLPSYPLGIEPFYPGLAASLAAWTWGRLSRV